MRQRMKRSRSSRRIQTHPTQRVRLELLALERRELLSVFPGFGSLNQVSGTTPWPSTSDTVGQSGTYYLSSEVEPSLAVDPRNPLHLVAVWQQDRWSNGGSRGIVAGASFDGGQTWAMAPIPGTTVNSGGTELRASDPWVTIGPDGGVYVDYLTINDPNLENPRSLSVSTSADGGLTWASPVAIITNTDNGYFNDKNTITADPYNAGYAYAVWDRLNFYNDTGPAMFSRTTDGGLTWSTPQPFLDPVYGQTIANQIVVLPGDVLVNLCITIDYATNAQTIVVMRSTDQGATWSGPITVAADQAVGISDPDTGTGVRTGDVIPSIAVDPRSGNLYIVWQDGRFSGGTHDDIAFSMSTDGGFTWSAPQKINQTPTGIPAGDQQAFTPAIAVAANGTIAVSYYDFRNNTTSAGLDTDYWLVTANPAQPGFTFGNEQRLTNSSFNMELAPYAYGLFVGDYEALVAGGSSFNTFGALFGIAVSSSDRASIFFRGAVPPNTLTLTQLTPPAAVEGQPFSGTLATFADASFHPDIATYSAIVTWGDGASDTLTAANGGIVSDGGGSFRLVGAHTYTEESAGLTFSVQIDDNAGGLASGAATITVADAPLTASPRTIATTEGDAVTSVIVATFTDANPYATAGDFTAVVNWGDGDTSASVSVAADGSVAGQFDVVASKSNPYAHAGTYPITVTISDVGGAMATANSSAQVADAPLTAAGVSFSPTEGASWTGTVATFTDAYTGDSISGYSATITWRDGGTSAGTVLAGAGPGRFIVRGTHTYVEVGTYAVGVAINDLGGSTAQASSTATVADAALSGAAVNFTTARNRLFTGVVATFSDANPYSSASDFTATIAWGDGHSSAGTVSVRSGGGFQVTGSHTYTKKGNYTFTVTILDRDGARLVVQGKATVSNAASPNLTARDAVFLDPSWLIPADLADPYHRDRSGRVVTG